MKNMKFGVLVLGLVLGLASCGQQATVVKASMMEESVLEESMVDSTTGPVLTAQSPDYCYDGAPDKKFFCGRITNSSKSDRALKITYDYHSPTSAASVDWLRPGERSTKNKDADGYYAFKGCRYNGRPGDNRWIKVSSVDNIIVNISC